MITVVIPAHNESQVIGRMLAALQRFSPIVVCNGCDDDTAEWARRCGDAVTVLETSIPSKVHALNLGDREAAERFPRFYVDADVIIDADSLQKMAKRLEARDVLAVSPGVRLDLAGASWAVRAFYSIDRRLPSSRETIGGSGVYGLSQAGRARFGEFPNVTADDAFVRRQFKPHERCVVERAYSTVTPPKTLSGVIAIKTRSHYGNYELDRLYPETRANVGANNRPALLKLALQPWLWPKLGVYAYVKVMARLRARARIRRGDSRWERDETSRQPVSVANVS